MRLAWAGKLVTILEQLREDRLDDPDHLSRLAQAHIDFAWCLEQLGRFTEAEAAYRQAISLYRTVWTNFPNWPESSVARVLDWYLYKEVAEVQRADGRLPEAEATYRQALSDIKTTFKDLEPLFDPGAPEAQVLSGLARCRLAAGCVEEAEQLYRQALQLCADNSYVKDGWAWFLATRPDAEHRDPRRAVELSGGSTYSPVHLGVAQYRAGDWKAAAARLGEYAQRKDGRNNGAGFFLAMAHWQLGEKDKARLRYQEACAWTDKCRPNDLELRRFRAEAAQLLGANEQNKTEAPGRTADKLPQPSNGDKKP
jgi:tetratricopeptide (TPR) repeat protein